MAMNGSYKVLDLKDTDITTKDGAIIPGIYESIEASGRNAILVSGVTIDGTEHRDAFVDVSTAGDTFTFTAYGKTFTVTKGATPEADKVTIA